MSSPIHPHPLQVARQVSKKMISPHRFLPALGHVLKVVLQSATVKQQGTRNHVKRSKQSNKRVEAKVTEASSHNIIDL